MLSGTHAKKGHEIQENKMNMSICSEKVFSSSTAWVNPLQRTRHSNVGSSLTTKSLKLRSTKGLLSFHYFFYSWAVPEAQHLSSNKLVKQRQTSAGVGPLLSHYHVGPRDGPRVFRFDSRCLCPPRSLTSQAFFFFFFLK